MNQKISAAATTQARCIQNTHAKAETLNPKQTVMFRIRFSNSFWEFKESEILQSIPDSIVPTTNISKWT
jgi:hypothetical protein